MTHYPFNTFYFQIELIGVCNKDNANVELNTAM